MQRACVKVSSSDGAAEEINSDTTKVRAGFMRGRRDASVQLLAELVKSSSRID